MRLYDLIIVAAATWYMAEMLTTRDGPFGIFPIIRERFPLGGLTTCPYCAAPYTALVFLIIYQFLPQIVWVFAAAGLAMALRFYVDEHNNGRPCVDSDRAGEQAA